MGWVMSGPASALYRGRDAPRIGTRLAELKEQGCVMVATGQVSLESRGELRSEWLELD